MSQTPTGQIVHYTLSEQDAAQISDRLPATGGHRNPVNPGDVYPALVVRDWGGSVNLQVMLDGDCQYWATSRKEGTEPGTWAYRTEG